MRRLMLLLSVLLLSLTQVAPSAAAPEPRIASPWPAQNAVIVMLGYGDNLVGTSATAQRIPLLRQSLPRITRIPAVGMSGGNEINPEQIIALGTQLLFVPQGVRVPQQDKLRQAGVTTLAFTSNSLAALTARVQQTANALGPDAQRRAQAWRHYLDDNVARVQTRLQDLKPASRIRVYHSMGSPLSTSGNPSLNQDWMNLAYARNVAADWFGHQAVHSRDVALEQVISANPQVIVAMNARDAQEMRTSPAWSGIDAVRHHRVYVNPQGMFWWCRETSEFALQFLWLARTLYPQRFTDIDMRAETRAFYLQFFRLHLSDLQVDEILNPEQRSQRQ